MARHHCSVFPRLHGEEIGKGAGITAVAAIVEHNTSGIISRKSDNVASPKDLVGKKYGLGMTQLELAMLKTLVRSHKVGTLRRLKKYQITTQTQSHRLPMEYLILHGSTTDGMVSLPNLKV